MATASEPPTNAGDFFEGTEKLLEVWFSEPIDGGNANLRNISRSFWDTLLSRVHCQIISHKCLDDIDAYILSESSMFVTQNRFILKTCGTTTLLNAVRPLVDAARHQCGFTKILDFFYSRKNFMRPDLQNKLHQTFDDEVSYLDRELFPDGSGAAYALGRINRDCWYLYTIDCVGVQQPDQTLELLMTDMDPEMMQVFTMERCKTGPDATKESGISELIPGAELDSQQFEPQGYSMNGILPGGYYFTIHVTPQPECSYVSFETNVEQSSLADLIKNVLACFRPRKVLATMFANRESSASKHLDVLQKDITDYSIHDCQVCSFKNYKLVYSHFTKQTPATDPYI